MEFSEFRETLELAREAHGWRPIGDLLASRLHSQVSQGIGDEAYLKLLGVFIAKPNQTPAHLLADIKAERSQQIKAAESAAPAGRFTGYAKMSPAEQASYRATIQRVKSELSETLARQYAEGQIPTAEGDRTGRGLQSLGGLLAGMVLKRGLDDLALEQGLKNAS